MMELKRLGVTIITGARAVEIKTEGVEIQKDQESSLLEADTVVIATGARSENRLVSEIGDVAPEFYIVGDAKEPRNALEAIREGFFTGLKI
jgi:thioredoxin reductase